jgi:hypothetical protein
MAWTSVAGLAVKAVAKSGIPKFKKMEVNFTNGQDKSQLG